MALDHFRAHALTTTDATRRVVRSILHPPFGPAARVFYRVLANAAIATLDPRDRVRLDLPRRRRYWTHLARWLLRGLSAIDAAGQPFDDPEAREALYAAIRANLRDVELIELDRHINDPEFAEALANKLLVLMKAQARK